MAPTARSGAAWAALSFVAFALGLALSLPVIGFLEGTLGLPHRLGLAAWAVVWGMIAIAGCIFAADVVFAVRPRLSPAALVVASIGIGLAATTQLTAFDWSFARYGRIDLELVGWTGGLFAILVGLGTAAFGMLIAPPRAAAWPAALALIGCVMTIAVGASNLTGLSDGPGESTWPLAAALELDGLYALAVGWVALRALQRSWPSRMRVA